jgi:hypothetical protein
MAVPPVPAEGTVEEVVVVVEEVKDILTAVAQLVVDAPLRWMVPVRIASRSSPAAPASLVALPVLVLVVAGVVAVLRFPLCLLYAVISVYIQNLSDFLIVAFQSV